MRSSRSNVAAASCGGFTKVPRPCSVTTTSSRTSSPMARRTVIGLTWNAAHSSASDGRRAPDR